MRKKFLGVGVYTPGKFVSVAVGTGRHTDEYVAWKGMLSRCYSKARSKGYEGSTVCEEWLDFQTFADWLHDNGHTKDKRVDKDILVQGNKLYSPATCCVVPIRINSLITSHSAGAGNKSRGVYTRVKDGRTTFVVRYVDSTGKRIKLCKFKSEEVAAETYRRMKKQVVKSHAESALAAGDISQRVYEALLVWEP